MVTLSPCPSTAMKRTLIASSFSLAIMNLTLAAQAGLVESTVELGEIATSVTVIGDVDGNGVPDIGFGDSINAGNTMGSAGIILMDTPETVLSIHPIDTGPLNLTPMARFGTSICAPGDIDGNGVPDLAVGARAQGFGNHGAVFVLFLESDATYSAFTGLGSGLGLVSGEEFGSSLCAIGDRDGNGVPDIAVGSPGRGPGAFRLVHLQGDGTLLWQQLISVALVPELQEQSGWSRGLDLLGDVDGDGVADFGVGSRGTNVDKFKGELWVLFMNADGTPRSHTRTSYALFDAGFTGKDLFGWAVAKLGDVDGDGVPDLAVSAPTGHAFDAGDVFVTFLASDGTVRHFVKHLSPAGTFDDFFGWGLAGAGDWNGDGAVDLLASDSGTGSWILELTGCAPASAAPRNGSGTNPMSLANVNGPIVGAEWIMSIDGSNHAASSYILYIANEPHPGLPTSFGELLVQPSGGFPLIVAGPHPGGPATHTLGVPELPSLCGREVSAQAMILGTPGPQFSNALDVTLGR